MAVDTSMELRNQVMYSVFVRNHTEEGTFQALKQDLDRIRSLGVDIIWLLPIYPIGEQARKGSLGSPYAIRDYRNVNPELGTMDDFRELVSAIHARGMRCIIDIVYNHTSPDSVLAAAHPEWFYHRPDGSFYNRIGDWTDIIDLDYSRKDLWAYQIETLKQWASLVDGFRCDVASLVPLPFWLEARKQVSEVRPDCLWLSESVEPEFIVWNRSRGIGSLSDSELYQAFDITYDYDIFGEFQRYLNGQIPLEAYADRINQQESIYPENYVKLRFLENHDRERIASFIRDPVSLDNWTAFLYFQKGTVLLYGGQEFACTHKPSLFEKDPFSRDSDAVLAPLLQNLYRIRQNPLLRHSTYSVRVSPDDFLVAEHRSGSHRLIGVFSVKGHRGTVPVDLPSGVYGNQIGGKPVEVRNGTIYSEGAPVILETGNTD